MALTRIVYDYALDVARKVTGFMGKDADRPTPDEINLPPEAEAAGVRSLLNSGRVEHDLPDWAAREIVRDMFREMRPHLPESLSRPHIETRPSIPPRANLSTEEAALDAAWEETCRKTAVRLGKSRLTYRDPFVPEPFSNPPKDP